jgi:hypothetical protein
MTPEKTFFEQIQWTQAWLAALSALWGGVVSYFMRIQSGQPHSLFIICMHLSMSGFAGLMCWLGCVQFGASVPITAICTGLAGHMGAEFIKILELKFQERINRIAD